MQRFSSLQIKKIINVILMTGKILDGQKIAEEIHEDVKKEVAKLKKRGIIPN